LGFVLKSFKFPKYQDFGKWIFYSALIGVVSGLGASAFFFLLQWGKFFVMDFLAGYPQVNPAGEQIVFLTAHTPFRSWLFFLIPSLGGLLSGLIVYSFAPEAEGHGTDAMIDAFHNKDGKIRTRVPYIKSIASIITLATGGSAGREGPIAQIGAGFGSWLGRILHLDIKQIRILLLAGTAGGLGAIFRAPLGAAIVSTEIVYREDFESNGIIPAVISSVVAYTIFSLFFGYSPIFETPTFTFSNPIELIIYAFLAIACAYVGIFYVRFFYGTRDYFFNKIPIKPHFKPAIGGLFVGIIGLFVPQALGGGYGYIQLAILGKLSIGLMIGIILFKILSTSFTISSGGSGGVFGPSIFIGAMIGGVIGGLGQKLFPEVVINPGAFVLVGMAGFFAGVAHAPIGSLLMVCEMTGNYGLLAPLMLVSAISILLNRRVSLYEKQEKNRFASKAHADEMRVNILSEIPVEDVYEKDKKLVKLKEYMTFSELRKVITETNLDYFPVVDDDNRLKGILSLRDLRTVLFEDSLKDLVVVGELAASPVSVSIDEDLYSALLKFIHSGFGQLPVVDSVDSDKILGLLQHQDVIEAYEKEVSKRKSAR